MIPCCGETQDYTQLTETFGNLKSLIQQRPISKIGEAIVSLNENARAHIHKHLRKTFANF